MNQKQQPFCSLSVGRNSKQETVITMQYNDKARTK